MPVPVLVVEDEPLLQQRLCGIGLQVNGDINLTGTATADVDVVGGGVRLKTHTHPGVTSGGSVTGPPV